MEWVDCVHPFDSREAPPVGVDRIGGKAGYSHTVLGSPGMDAS